MKKIVELFPLFAVILVYFGFCNLHHYYKVFGVNIISYVTPQEVIFSFLPVINYLIGGTVSWFFSVILNDNFRIKNEKKIVLISVESEPNNSIPKKSSWFTKHISSIILASLFIIAVIIRGILPKSNFDGRMMATLVSLVLLMFSILTYGRSANIDWRRITSSWYFLIGFIAVGSFVIDQFRTIDAYSTIYKNPVDKVIIVKSDTSFSTNDSLIFIGETERFVFLFDKKKNNTRALNRSEIKEIQFPPNKNYQKTLK